MPQSQPLVQELNAAVAVIKAGAYDQITQLNLEIRNLKTANKQVNSLLQACCEAAGCDVNTLHERVTALSEVPQRAKTAATAPGNDAAKKSK